jgi:hypothetical protein
LLFFPRREAKAIAFETGREVFSKVENLWEKREKFFPFHAAARRPEFTRLREDAAF